jgi:hypothetical protein
LLTAGTPKLNQFRSIQITGRGCSGLDRVKPGGESNSVRKVFYALCAVPTLGFFFFVQAVPFIIEFFAPIIACVGLVAFFRAKKDRWLLLVAIMIAIWPSLLIGGVDIYLNWQSNPPYIVEDRETSADGKVTYKSQHYAECNHLENIAGLREHTQDIIYQSIYADGLQYCFSKSGHVYAMVGNQNDDPSIFVHEWVWSGNPHDFPYFDYSKTCPYCSP